MFCIAFKAAVLGEGALKTEQSRCDVDSPRCCLETYFPFLTPVRSECLVGVHQVGAPWSDVSLLQAASVCCISRHPIPRFVHDTCLGADAVLVRSARAGSSRVI